MVKRFFDFFLTLVGLVLLAPFLVVIALWIKLDSTGPVFFRQERVGMDGNIFRIHKFRTMVVDAEEVGGQLTVGEDRRITRSGCFLRKYKLDELPQLIDVVLGDMSLVGPRPEVPRYVAEYTDEVRRIVQSVRPGITDLASIAYKDENRLLANSSNPEKDYVERILPKKLKYYEAYVRERTLWLDLVIIFKTITSVFLRR